MTRFEKNAKEIMEGNSMEVMEKGLQGSFFSAGESGSKVHKICR